MTKSEIDNNGVSTGIGVLNTDGLTIVQLKASPTTHILATSIGTGGSDFGQDNAERDVNGETVLMATSSADGVTPVSVYLDSSNNLLLQST